MLHWFFFLFFLNTNIHITLAMPYAQIKTSFCSIQPFALSICLKSEKKNVFYPAKKKKSSSINCGHNLTSHIFALPYCCCCCRWMSKQTHWEDIIIIYEYDTLKTGKKYCKIWAADEEEEEEQRSYWKQPNIL